MKSNRTTIVFFVIVGLAVCVVLAGLITQVLPKFMASPGGMPPVAATPLPRDAVTIEIHSSNTKEHWLDEVTEDFNSRGFTTSGGHTIIVLAFHVTSGGSYNAIMDGEIQPTIWSPGSRIWVNKANQTWRDRTGRPLVPNADACPATIQVPLVIGMWRPMAEALGWPDKPLGWQDMAELATNPEGWAAYGHPEWGQFKFGHAHPDFSNSAMLSMISEVYSAAGKTAGLTVEDIKSQPVRDNVGAVEQAIVHYGKWDKWILDKMVERGPEYLHATPTYENNVVDYNRQHAAELRFPLAAIYPRDGTFWVDNPLCILDADWVTDEQREAAEVFHDFFLSPEQQQKAVQWALRPADSRIGLSEPIDLAHGAVPSMTPDNVPPLKEPSDEVVGYVSELWHEVKKKAVCVVLLDRSGSMKGGKMKAAVEGVNLFIDQMNPEDQIIVVIFNDLITELRPIGAVGEVGEPLRTKISNIYAESGTALHQTVIYGIDRIEGLRNEYGDERLYGIVLLSDGKNEMPSGPSKMDMLNRLPSGTEAAATKIFTIAYGDDADVELLQTIANRTNALSLTGTEKNIAEIYLAISSYF
jgi:Ca-activated chloride channel family protein